MHNLLLIHESNSITKQKTHAVQHLQLASKLDFAALPKRNAKIA